MSEKFSLLRQYLPAKGFFAHSLVPIIGRDSLADGVGHPFTYWSVCGSESEATFIVASADSYADTCIGGVYFIILRSERRFLGLGFMAQFGIIADIAARGLLFDNYWQHCYRIKSPRFGGNSNG